MGCPRIQSHSSSSIEIFSLCAPATVGSEIAVAPHLVLVCPSSAPFCIGNSPPPPHMTGGLAGLAPRQEKKNEFLRVARFQNNKVVVPSKSIPSVTPPSGEI